MSESANLLWMKQRSSARYQAFKLTHWMFILLPLRIKLAYKLFTLFQSILYVLFRVPWASSVSDCPYLFQCHQEPTCTRVHQRLSCQGVPLYNIDAIWKYVTAPDDHWLGPSLAFGWEKVHRWPGQPQRKKVQLHLVVQVNTFGPISEEEHAFKADWLQPSWVMEHV